MAVQYDQSVRHWSHLCESNRDSNIEGVNGMTDIDNNAEVAFNSQQTRLLRKVIERHLERQKPAKGRDNQELNT